MSAVSATTRHDRRVPNHFQDLLQCGRSEHASVDHTRVEDHDGTDEARLSVVEAEVIENVSELELFHENLPERHLVHQVTARNTHTAATSTE